jgi:PEP-CTERM motif-containing protein
MKTSAATLLAITLLGSSAWAGPYAPPAGQPGSTAIANTSPLFVEWANGFQNLIRGPLDIANPGGGNASFGTGNEALGPADGNSSHVVSLGDGGQITLGFAQPITNGPGADLAVFENSFSDIFLELAFVEVSSNGVDFVRFPAVSLTQSTTQVGTFGSLDATNLDNLAGKYRGGFGTPFDLSQVAGLSVNVDVNHIQFVRVIDVIGTIAPALGSRDSLGNLVNDPYPTAFASGGFDLDGVGVIHAIPEPASAILLAIGAVLAGGARKRRGC